jgi:O-antigen ligase
MCEARVILDSFKCVFFIAMAVLLGQLLLIPKPLFFMSAVVLVVLPVFFLMPHLYFIGFIIFRPIVDMAIKGGLRDANLSSLVVIPLLGLCFKDILFNEDYIKKIMENSFLKGFNTFFMVFIFIALLSLFNSEDFKTSLADFLRLISLLIASNYAVAYFGTKKEGFQEFTKYVLWSSLFPITVGLYQFVTKTGIHELGLNRIYGTFGHCNVFAEYLFLIIFLGIFTLSRKDQESGDRIMLIGLTGVAALCLYLTYTRTLWIAFAISIVFYLLLKRRLFKKLIYFILIGVAAFFFQSKIHERFNYKTTKQEGRNSWEWRMDLWRDTMKDIRQHPISGHGLGMFEYDNSRTMAHNDFLRLSYETGVPGAVVFYGLFFYVLIYSLKNSLMTKISYEKDKFALAFCLTLGLLVSSMGVNTLRSTVIMFYFIMAITLLAQKRDRYYEDSFDQ